MTTFAAPLDAWLAQECGARSPVHAMQAIQVKQPLTNQSVTRGRHMDPWAHKGMQIVPKEGGHREPT